jgi:uncharacterized repeat protein (TIGR01451 family)
MKRKHIVLLLVAIGVTWLVLLVSWVSAVPVAADPNRQGISTPRPTLTPTRGPPGPPPRLHGGILDWGKGYMPADVKVTLRGEDWEIPVKTDDYGQYRYQSIGNEVAFLNAIVPRERWELKSLTTDLPVRVRVDGELIVNLAFYPENIIPDPIVTIEMVASATEAKQGDEVSFTITVNNNWDDWVNEVIVADYLPEGLSYVSASASQGEVIWDRGLVWATLGAVEAGSSATVTVVTKVEEDAELGQTITNRAGVIYRENVAVQVEASLQVSEKSNNVLPVTGAASLLPVAGVLLAGLLFGVRKLRR